MTQPVIRVADLKLTPRPDEWLPQGAAAARFDARTARVAGDLGLRLLGCTVTEVKAGCTAYPYHSHRANDELFYILAGTGELRLGSERHPVRAGDLVGCPTGGPQTAHQLINTGTEPLRYLAISTRSDPEVCEYPDSGKVGAYCGKDDQTGLMHVTRAADEVDYWLGE